MKDVILQDVLDFILKCKDNDKLVEINELLRDRLKTNSSRLKHELKAGDVVKVKGNNKQEKGIILKVNRTRAIVRVRTEGLPMQWNVPFTMLTKLETSSEKNERI